MTREELFKKYHIDESHSQWSGFIDNWMSVEVFRIMNDGRLPEQKDNTLKYVLDFLDKAHKERGLILNDPNGGSMYLTAKRMVYRFADQILLEINS